MISAWLVYDAIGVRNNQSYIDWFILEAKKQQMDLKLILRENIHIGIKNNKPTLLLNQEKVTLPQVAIIRTIDPILSRLLEQIGIAVFNNSEIATICNHKGSTHQVISKLGIPMVDTYFYQKQHLPNENPLPFPFVIKNVHGKGGQEVFFIKNYNEWVRIRDKLDREIILQTANVKHGKDLRVYVLGDDILAAVLRENESSFKANFTLGGRASLYDLQESEKILIHQIISQFDFDFVGIDFLISHNDELLFNEIEDVVGSRMLSKLTNMNVLEKYVSHILKKLK